MKRYKRLCMYMLGVYLAAVLLFEIFYYFFSSNVREDRFYDVDINRVISVIEKDGGSVPDLGAYKYIRKVEFLNRDAGNGEINNFYNNDNRVYEIRSIVVNNEQVFVKCILEESLINNTDDIILTADILFLIVLIMMVTGMAYFGHRLLRPFNEIQEMPFELAKGHIATPVKEIKNRYFGRFTWGLDMLREQLEYRRNREYEMEKDKKTLLLSISHDIKTPLSSIKMYVRALQRKLYTTEARQLEALDGIYSNAESIEASIGEIMSTVANDFLEIDVRNGDFYLDELLNDIRKYYDEIMELNHVRLSVESSPNCILHGDRERAVEVLQNIIENALKYGDKEYINISVSEEEECKLITVTNSGNKLPADEVVHIFESFYRGSNALEKKGNGLGLYICRQIMKLMNGDIFARAEGNTMSVTIVIRK